MCRHVDENQPSSFALLTYASALLWEPRIHSNALVSLKKRSGNDIILCAHALVPEVGLNLCL